MKKLILGLMLAVSFGASANGKIESRGADVVFQFQACNEDWQVRHNVENELVSLDLLNKNTGIYDWTVSRGYDAIIKNKETPDEFMNIFLVSAADKLQRFCDDSGGGTVPTDWDELISYIIKNELSYDAQNNKVIRN